MNKPKGVPTNAPLVSAENVAAVETSTAIIEVPMLKWGGGYIRRRFDVQLTYAQAESLKSMQLGLEKREATLANGKFVANPTDAIRWMLENLIS